jgi:leucyl aminopeptidase
MTDASLPIICVAEGDLAAAGLDDRDQAWAKANSFSGQRGRLLPLPAADGAVRGYLFGTGGEIGRPKLVTGLAAAALEPGRYSLKGALGDPTLAALGFELGAYRFDRYRKGRSPVELSLPAGADRAEVARLAAAARLARDLVNTPANDLGPDAYEAEIRAFAAARGMTMTVIKGDDLLAQNFPMIHAVGRASTQAPRLIDLTWGNPGDPKVTLVGKGVTFDTGGLDIKPSSNMILMKKDMGGSANVLGLAHAIADARLKVRLRVLLAVVENSIAGNAFRPSDILPSRLGLSVEIGNTDAEGRLVLADALALADEETPAVLIDMATLTGAARVALGPELPPLFSTDDALAEAMMAAGLASDDPLWRLPLWASYDAMLNSRIADLNNAPSGGFAGAITAALFLKRFVTRSPSWTHLDLFAWAPEPRAGRPFGATDQGIRASYHALRQRFGTRP